MQMHNEYCFPYKKKKKNVKKKLQVFLSKLKKEGKIIYSKRKRKPCHRNLFLIYPDISIDRQDIKTESLHSSQTVRAPVMNGSPLAYIFFLEARTVSKNRVCHLSGIWDRSAASRGASERSD